MDWIEWVRTPAFLTLWKATFADAKRMIPVSQGPHASERAYTERRALWVEIREPLDGVRLITLELPTDVNPPRVYLRVWTYRPQGAPLYAALVAHSYKWQDVPVARYLNERPHASWQSQLNVAGVEVDGIRHYLDVSPLVEASQQATPEALHDILESFCTYVATVAISGQSQDVPARTGPERTSDTPPAGSSAPKEEAGVAASKTEPIAQKSETFVPEIQDVLRIGHDPRFSQEPPPVKVALANARIGQGGYRQRMLDVWGRRCAMTGCPVEAVLIASHARPWSLCDTAQQCLDEYNGLLLSANLDRLFDQGLIAFADDGAVISSGESAIDVMLTASRLRYVHPRHVPYLAWHRNYFGLAETRCFPLGNR